MAYLMNNSELIELCRNEHLNLRHEMNHLRTCQMQFLSFGIAGSATIFGLLSRDLTSSFNTPDEKFYFSIFFFIPLVLLIPSMFIFFDKAKTFNRIVGYYYWIERVLSDETRIPIFHGWENSLRIFRATHKDDDKIKFKINQIMEVFKTNRLYWKYTFIFFTLLMVICFIPSLTTLATGFDVSQPTTINLSIIVILMMILTGYSIMTNAAVFFHLVEGNFSAEKNTEKWGVVLKINKCPKCNTANTTFKPEQGEWQWICSDCGNKFIS